MAGDEGFEPPILGPEPSALPLGQSPIARKLYHTTISDGEGYMRASCSAHVEGSGLVR